MATKEQERKALAEITEIIRNLGTESYIGAAINNYILTMAAENIDNDWLISPLDQIENAERKAEEARKEANEAVRKLTADLDAATKLQTTWKQQLDRRDSEMEVLSDNYKHLMEERDKARAAANENGENLAAAQAEIIKLKAKLYDLMTA